MSYETAARCLLASTLLTVTAPGVAAGHDSPAVKSLNDDARRRLYVLVRDGVELLEQSTRRKVAHIALPGWTWAGELYSCPPDITLTPQGDILVTSNVVPVIWRIEHRTLATTMHPLALDQDQDRDIGFTRLRWSASLRTFIATTDLGESWHVDPALEKARKVSSAPTGRAMPSCE